MENKGPTMGRLKTCNKELIDTRMRKNLSFFTEVNKIIPKNRNTHPFCNICLNKQMTFLVSTTKDEIVLARIKSILFSFFQPIHPPTTTYRLIVAPFWSNC